MKKWLVGVAVVFLLFLISSYFFIPTKIEVINSITANANQSGVYRFLSSDSNWRKWWPGSTSMNEGSTTVFESDGYRFKNLKPLYNSFELIIEKNKNIDSSLLHIFSLGNDSIKIEWNAAINTGSNPFSKIRLYFKAKELSKTIGAILTAMQKNISNVKNLYGIDIKKEKVKIEFLVSTRKSFTHYPTTEEIYEMVSRVKKYIALQQSKEEDYPMLHVNTYDSPHFEAQVAIPVDKKLPDNDIFSSKRMLKNGNILVTEITGSNSTADSALKQIDLYAADHRYNNVAIPFQSLITNRMKEADTTKWVTRIYYPIR